MQKSYAPPLAEQPRNRAINLNPEGAEQTQQDRGKILPAILLAMYLFNLWIPPRFYLEPRWYMLLALAIFCYFVQRKSLNAKALSLYWLVSGLALIGALLALVRAPDFDNALFNTTAMVIGMITMMLFIPTFATPVARKAMLIAQVFIGLTWAVEVHRIIEANAGFSSLLFIDVNDKNRISLCMALTATIFLAFATLWQPNSRTARRWVWLLRLAAGGMGVFLIYTLSLTFSRSGVITAFAGITVVLIFFSLQEKGKTRIFRLLTGSGAVIILYLIFSPQVAIVSPKWGELLEEGSLIQDIDSYGVRQELINKARSIILEDPIIGIGAGNSKPVYFSSDRYLMRGLIHNAYLSSWAELGILGLLSNLIFITAYIAYVKRKFRTSELIDKIWLILFIPFFVDMLFLEIGSVSQFMLVLLSGFYYMDYTNLMSSSPSPLDQARGR
jgi:hypothetical protein